MFNLKKAFTLAEVLITLTIIGVIAALTIPNLMRKYDKHVHEVRFKQAYSYFMNSIQNKMKEEGCSDINCVLANNGFNPNATSRDYDAQVAIMKLFFKEVEKANAYSKGWYGWYNRGEIKMPLGGTGAVNTGIGANPMLLNKKIGIATTSYSLSNGSYPYMYSCNYDGQYLSSQYKVECIVTFLYTAADTKEKPEYGKNVFYIRIKGNGTLMATRDKNWYTKDYIIKNLYEKGGIPSYGCEAAAVYMARNGWNMDYYLK